MKEWTDFKKECGVWKPIFEGLFEFNWNFELVNLYTNHIHILYVLDFVLSSLIRKGKKQSIQNHTHLDSMNLIFKIWGTQLSNINQRPVLDLNSYISKSLFFGNFCLALLTVWCVEITKSCSLTIFFRENNIYWYCKLIWRNFSMIMKLTKPKIRCFGLIVVM